jgi:hypothetical protein
VCERVRRAASSSRHAQTHTAPFRSRADHQEPTRSAPGRVGQFRSQSTVRTAPQRLPRAHQALPQVCLTPAHLPRTPDDPAQQRARRGNQCTHAKCSPECRLPRHTPRTAAPSPKEPRRAAGTPRHAPHLLRAARITVTDEERA